MTALFNNPSRYLLCVLLFFTASAKSEHRITVSGISAGGYMAHQLHVAYSDRISGAGVIAAGPYNCAEGNLATAMGRCMAKANPGPDPEAIVATIRAMAERDQVAPPANLEGDPVWILRGRNDAIVAPDVVVSLETVYQTLGSNVVARYDLPFAHHFPTESEGSPCDSSTPPFLGQCDFDAAGQILKHLYPDLQPPSDGPAGAWETVEVTDAQAAHLLATAYRYQPPECDEGSCDVHVVLHGCAQSSATVAKAFVEGAGYQRWADTNGLVLLFPQVQPSPVNPYACWDWWGYSGSDYLTRNGVQVRAIMDLAVRAQ